MMRLAPALVLAGCFTDSEPVQGDAGTSRAPSSSDGTGTASASPSTSVGDDGTGDVTSTSAGSTTEASTGPASTGPATTSVDDGTTTGTAPMMCLCGYAPDWGNYACVTAPVDPQVCPWQPQMGMPCDAQRPAIDEIGCCSRFGEVVFCNEGVIDMWSCEDERYPDCQG